MRDDVLTRHVGRRGPAPTELTHAWRLLLRNGGTIRVDRLASEVGWSRRYLNRCFSCESGLSPKDAARVVRLHRSRITLQRPDRPTLAELPPGTGSVYLVTDQVDALFERARAAGATVVHAGIRGRGPRVAQLLGARPGGGCAGTSAPTAARDPARVGQSGVDSVRQASA